MAYRMLEDVLTRVILLGIPERAKLPSSVADWNFEGDSFQQAQPLLDFVPLESF
jgi:hypothetical protein